MPKNPSKHTPVALLSHDLIKYWLANTTSINTRDAKRVDISHFIQAFKIKSMDDFKQIGRPDIINY